MHMKSSLWRLPALTLSRFAGVFPFGYHGDRKILWTLWSVVVTCCVGPTSFSLACYQVTLASMSESTSKTKELTFTSLELFKSVLFSSSLLLHVYVTARYRKIFKRVIQTIMKLGITSFGSSEVIFGSVVLGLRFLCIIYALSKSKDLTDIYVLRSNAIINILCWLNYLLTFQMISFLSSIVSQMQRRKDISKYYMIDVDHHALNVDVAQDIVFLYGRQLLFITGQCVFAATTSCYYLMTNIMFSHDKLALVLHSIDVLSFLISSYQLFVLTKSCEVINEKVDAFYKELFRLMRESKTLCNNKKLCLYVSMRKTVNFTACGFFNLGYPLITSIIAAATTYLVILVQFSIPK